MNKNRKSAAHITRCLLCDLHSRGAAGIRSMGPVIKVPPHLWGNKINHMKQHQIRQDYIYGHAELCGGDYNSLSTEK